MLTQESGDAFWRFKHPTIGDAYASILVHSPELLGIYIRGSAPEKLDASAHRLEERGLANNASMREESTS